jgi:FAD/FMN-containing dehydrogenase
LGLRRYTGALKYGVTYNHVLAVEAVLSDGTVIQLSADDDGPDVLGVLIGSEGTLGILIEATVALRPIAPVTRSLMGSFATAHDAAATVAAIIQTGTVPAAVEWLDHTGIVGLQQFTDTGYPSRWKDVPMSRTRRSFTTEYKVEAAHRVIDSGRTIAEVARELGVNEGLLGRWVADERRRVEAAAARDDVPLTPAERTELARLRKQVAEQEKDIAFLKKASAYFAASQPK